MTIYVPETAMPAAEAVAAVIPGVQYDGLYLGIAEAKVEPVRHFAAVVARTRPESQRALRNAYMALLSIL